MHMKMLQIKAKWDKYDLKPAQHPLVHLVTAGVLAVGAEVEELYNGWGNKDIWCAEVKQTGAYAKVQHTPPEFQKPILSCSPRMPGL